MGQRPPRTSYGYLAPPEARLTGWECRNDGCGMGDEPAPRSWPHLCRHCGRPTDATFEEPWAHEAKGYRIRHELGSSSLNRYRREAVLGEQQAWAYKDALLRDDRAAADRAWQTYRRSKPPPTELTSIALWPMQEMVRLAAIIGDVDRAADEVMQCYPFIDTHDVDNDNTTRTISRTFVSICIDVLQCESSIDHPREAELFAAMRDIAGRIEGVLMDHHHRGFQRINEIRAFHRSRAAIALSRRSKAAAHDGLPNLAWSPEPRVRPPVAEDPRGIIAILGANAPLALTLIDLMIDAAQTHDDTGPLDDLVRHLDRSGISPSLTHLLRARLHVITADLDPALRDLDRAARATDRFALTLRPQILATQGLLLARGNPEKLEDGIVLCRAGRNAGLRPWRRTTPADAPLARLLLWRALRQEPHDITEAVHLIRRRCRPWRVHGADDRLLLQEALAARDALTDRGNDEHRHRAWSDSVDAPWSTAARARLAAAWAEWAVGTGVAQFAAEAYQQLVALATQDAVARYGAGAKQRVLAAAQEYAEEAGYWLARTGRYREAVLALETGRAVGLTEVLGRDNAAVFETLRAAGHAGLASDYRDAIADFDEQERHPTPKLRHAWTRLREVARRVAAVTGADPLAIDVSYGDITAETGDGAIVYLSAAKAGGYALVVAATHDPQYIDLPKLDRATVAGLAAQVLPDGIPGRVRDLAPMGKPQQGQNPLRTLWTHGIRDLVLMSARGRVVTIVPIGLFNLLPLHAAGEPGMPGDQFTEWRHIGNFSAIRYAPNVRGLRRCRDTARELAHQQQTLLAIDVPTAHGVKGGYLPYVARETAEVTRRWTGSPARPVTACTWQEFRSAADHHTVWHLACHGSAEPGSILDSRLYFADREVTLDELRRALKPGPRRLAVLSACRTNLSGSAMPNEVVGLPSALIQIGFAGVIASSWAVDDLATTYLMTAFYHWWCGEGEEPAVALSRAQQWLRTATRADLIALLPDVDPGGRPGQCPYVDPTYWAAFAYTGA